MILVIKIFRKIIRLYDFIKVNLIFRFLFKKIGWKSVIKSGIKLSGCACIEIGNETIIEKFSWIAAEPLTGEDRCSIKIGSNVALGRMNHIFATKSIVIENHVLTADKVYISDNLHIYENPLIPIKDQGIKQIGCVRIQSGAWIGENACIIGASVGKNSVVAANAVVTSDVPDFCVVAGIPAKIIKRYNPESGIWEKMLN